ncbi:MAG: chlororespiratory reduction protein 7 [Cyanobacteriota bacterium]|nr:chlororespiratory reduction protein 7 [Cyanobacteriota bacterium]
MSDPLLREMDHYVVLEPGGEDAILSASDTRAWLARHLSSLASPPADLAHLSALGDRVERLLETACELELAPGLAIQWFAVRLERPELP